MEEETVVISLKEYGELKKIKKDKAVCDEVLDYLVKGVEEILNGEELK